MATKAHKTKTARTKPSVPRYLYAATLKATGELVRTVDNGAVAGTDSHEVKRLGEIETDGDPVKVVRFVLEASVRPGGA